MDKQISSKDTSLLTKRELQIAHGLLEGGRVSTLAENLCLSKETIRHHLKSIFQKFGVHSQSELVDFLRTSRLDNLPIAFSSISEMESFIKSTNQRILDNSQKVGSSDGSLEEKFASCLLFALPITDSRRFEWIIRLRYWNETLASTDAVAKEQTPQREAIEDSLNILSSLVEQGIIADNIDLNLLNEEIVDLTRSVAFRALHCAEPDYEEIIKITRQKVSRLMHEFRLDPAQST